MSRSTDHELLSAQETEAAGKSGCGCGGGCGSDTGTPEAAAPVLTIDPRLDVRTIPHDQRHAAVFAALDGLAVGGALVLVAPHAPLPLLAEIESRYEGQFDVEWLQQGPAVWQVRLPRRADSKRAAVS